MSRPNFFIVGAPKCGTTALSSYLREHPGIFMSWPKEPHYFAHDFAHYKQSIPSLDKYLNLFEAASSAHLAVGEASVWYMYSNDAVPEIMSRWPDAKIIVMLRDPVEVVRSVHSQLVWTFDEDERDLERAWGLQGERAMGRSIPSRCREPAFLQYKRVARFGEQLLRLKEHVPLSQLLIIDFRSFSQSPKSAYHKVLEFLDVPDDGRQEFPRINPSKDARSRALSLLLQRPPKVLASAIPIVKRMLGRESLGWRRYALSLNAKVRRPPSISEPFRASLHDEFRSDQDVVRDIVSEWVSVYEQGIGGAHRRQSKCAKS